MTELSGAAFVGLLTGIFGIIFVLNSPGSALFNYKEAMEQCEAELPRHQKCVMVYAPIVEQE